MEWPQSRCGVIEILRLYTVDADTDATGITSPVAYKLGNARGSCARLPAGKLRRNAGQSISKGSTLTRWAFFIRAPVDRGCPNGALTR